MIIVHSADLSNAIKSFSTAQQWTYRLYKEFNLQVSLMIKTESVESLTAILLVRVGKIVRLRAGTLHDGFK